VKKIKLGQLYYYASLNGIKYLVRIFAVTEGHSNKIMYRVKYYNTRFKNRGYSDTSKKGLDCAFNSPKHIFRELNKNEEAKALLLGL